MARFNAAVAGVAGAAIVVLSSGDGSAYFEGAINRSVWKLWARSKFSFRGWC